MACARSLTPREQTWVADHLAPGEARLFWAQAKADQRHAHDVARWVAGRPDAGHGLIRAALLHDVGKRHTRLGVIGRSLATIAHLLGLPLAGRLRRYMEHGPLGAADLADLGVEPAVEAFARFHHQAPPARLPDDLTAADWAILVDADHRA